MQNITSAVSLKTAIAELEAKQSTEAAQLRQQFQTVQESIKPSNLIKSAFHQVVESDEIKGNLLNTTIGWGAGYVSKALFQGASHSAGRKFLGTVLMFGVSNLVAKHPIKIKAAGLTILDTIIESLPAPIATALQNHQAE